jgi:hypothetical protein
MDQVVEVQGIFRVEFGPFPTVRNAPSGSGSRACAFARISRLRRRAAGVVRLDVSCAPASAQTGHA